jgi:hypothetical protein
VDQTREVLNQPPQAAAAATTQLLGPTAAQNLLTALSDLRNTQNNFMSVWLNYYATRMVLVRELGLMELDEHGVWRETPLDEAIQAAEQEGDCELPPELPETWLTQVGTENFEPVEEEPAGAKPVQAEVVRASAQAPLASSRRVVADPQRYVVRRSLDRMPTPRRRGRE